MSGLQKRAHTRVLAPFTIINLHGGCHYSCLYVSSPLSEAMALFCLNFCLEFVAAFSLPLRSAATKID